MKYLILLFLLLIPVVAYSKDNSTLVKKYVVYNLVPISVVSGSGAFGVSSTNSWVGYHFLIKEGDSFKPRVIKGDISIKNDSVQGILIEEYCREFYAFRKDSCMDEYYIIHVPTDYIK